MKRFTLLFLFLLSSNLSFSQAVSLVEAPLNSNNFSPNRGPNGSAAHAFVRGTYLVRQSEFFNVPLGSVITSFGFTLGTGTTGMPASGNFTVYVENTADVTYQKGTNFTTAISTMTNVFAGIMTVPVSVGTTSVIVTLSSPFTYTGGGLYIGYDWSYGGPYVAGPAQYLGETAGLPLPGGGGAIAYDGLAAPATTTLTGARPSFLFGFTNPNSNDIQVIGLEAPGKVSATFNTPHIVRAYIKNASTITQNNISVNLNVTGANLFNNIQVIPSLAPGAGILVNFLPFNPTTLGLNTLSVSVPNDQNNSNNSMIYTQSVTCNEWSPVPYAPTGYTVTTLGFQSQLGANGIIAINYSPPVSTTLIGLRAAIGTSPLALNGQACGVLLTAGGVIVATTNTITVTAPMQGTFQNFTFSTPQNLTFGTNYYLGFVQITLNALMAGMMPVYYQSTFPYWFASGTTGGVMSQLPTNYGHMGIEAVFGNGNIPVTSTPTAVCLGACATLSTSGMSTYTWSNGNNGPSTSVCPTVAATYSVVSTNTLGCPVSGVVSVGVNQLPNVNVNTLDNSICVGAPFSFTATGASTYSWINGPATATNVTNPAAPTTYTVIGTDALGCSKTATIDVTLITLTTSISSPTAICRGKSTNISVSGVDPTYTYNWLIGTGFPFASLLVTPTITTTYTVNITDINGCMQTQTTMVTVNANPTLTASSTRSMICKGESTGLNALGADTYTWTGGQSGASITATPQVNTNYIVTGTNAAGCTHSTNVFISVYPCTGIAETSAGGLFQVFPNPNSGLFSISIDGGFAPGSQVEIYNTLGALIRKQVPGPEAKLEIDLSGEPAGLYILQIIDGNQAIHVSKMIKH
jgi:hypothetical protein